ncbi:MAG: PHP domain-containing protein [Candidatus Pacebacteria bacterium]|nr:PHP domain-containing protein [Candidatus Paceibacterota bacterium]MCF7917326.1 PHP domain-containing protein [Candidatus Omnitrophota bacterium]
MNNIKPPVPLHLHHQYDRLDGMLKIDEAVEFCVKNNIPACAMTLHGKFEGWLKFYKTCINRKIKPLIGYEAYVKNHNAKKLFHITLLPKNHNALSVLFKKVNKKVIKQQKSGGKIRIEFTLKEILQMKDIIVLSGCLAGILNNHDDPEKVTLLLKKHLGDNFYLEMQTFTNEDQRNHNYMLLSFAEKYNIKYVITSDSHYSDPDDAEAQKYMMASAINKKMSDMKYFAEDDFYMYNAERIMNNLNYLQDEVIYNAVENTYDIADQIDIKWNTEQVNMPQYKGDLEFCFGKTIHID